MITLVRMTPEEYRVYLEKLIPEYAAEKVKAGNWTAEEALEHSRQDMEHYLPQGVDTPRNFVGKLLNETGQTVGYLWYAQLENYPATGFIYDFEIYAPFRRRGYATQALKALELHAKSKGINKLELHVFGFNTAARELYRKAGYIETNIQMSREI